MIRSRLALRRSLASRGFTLLELMVVLLIIGLLMSVAAYNFIGSADTGRVKTTAMTLKTVESALEQYYINAGSYPPAITALVPKYLKEEPKDAWDRSLVYFPSTTGPAKFTLYSTGKSGEQGNEDNIDVTKIKEIINK
jgi:general secretion pathway protein G